MTWLTPATSMPRAAMSVAVSHVINFDLPNTPEAYTHRIGRTGRSECTGKAYTFATHEDFPAVKDIEKTLGMSIPRIKLKDFVLQDDSVVVPPAPLEASGPRGGGRAGAGRSGGGRSGGGRSGSAGGRRSGAAKSGGGGQGAAAGKPRRTRGAVSRGASSRTSASGEAGAAKPAKRSVLGYRGTPRSRSL